MMLVVFKSAPILKRALKVKNNPRSLFIYAFAIYVYLVLAQCIVTVILTHAPYLQL